MSDEQKMPDHADLIKRLHNFLDYGPHPKTHNQCVAEAVTAIATLTAERDAQDEKCDRLEARAKKAEDSLLEVMLKSAALSAQLKEQDDA